MDNQQGPTVEHRGLCSMFVAAWMEGEFWGRMGTCVCIAESLYYSPELSHGLLISYSPIQNKIYIYFKYNSSTWICGVFLKSDNYQKCHQQNRMQRREGDLSEFCEELFSGVFILRK